jgi:hypothetical protein
MYQSGLKNGLDIIPPSHFPPRDVIFRPLSLWGRVRVGVFGERLATTLALPRKGRGRCLCLSLKGTLFGT